jgi:hypothetical protein
MRLGCGGCLGSLALLAVCALLVGGAAGAARRALAKPDDATPPLTTAADGTRAQQKLFDVARGGRRGRTVTLSEAEVNALLARHLVEARGVRLGAPSARLLANDRVELTARLPLGQLLDEAGVGALADVLPSRWRERLVWVHVGARAHVEEGPRRQLRLDVENFAIGRQRLPARALRLLLDPGLVGLLRWPLPREVESVSVEAGRVVIRAAS